MQNDLISRSALIEAFVENDLFLPEVVKELIENQPTAYDVDKVVEAEEKFLVNYGVPKNTPVHRKIIDIVRNGGKE